ncbi:MAG: hypothetical protein JO131_07095 [Gammaproteobacteria bacterium]|nr:hypothetical protein [Gammaproteobacteria bacterium]
MLNILQSENFKRISDRSIAAMWLGVVVVSISLLATAIVLPLSLLVGAIIIISLSLLSLLSTKRTRTEFVALRHLLTPQLFLGFFALELGVAEVTTQQVNFIDTGLYHYGIIKWLSEFGAVPGIALLFGKFGFTSSWFALAAPFNPKIFDSRGSAVINGFIFLITILQFLISSNQLLKKQAKLSDYFLVVFSAIVATLFITTKLMLLLLVSPSPDIPVILLAGVVVWSILIASNQKILSNQVKANIIDDQIVPLLLASGAVTMKLSAIPLLFISTLFYIFAKGLQFSIRRILIASAIILLLLLPMFVNSIITSGCPLFPSTFLCLNLPWSISVSDAIRNAMDARDIGSLDPAAGSPPTGPISLLWWMWQWFKVSNLNKSFTFLVVISIVSTFYITRTIKNIRVSGHLWAIALGVSGITFTVIEAPNIRFGLGYLIVLPALAIAIFWQLKGNRILPDIIHRLTSYYLLKGRLMISLFFLALFIVISINSNLQSRILLPLTLTKVKLLQKQVNDVKYFSPLNVPNEPCWGSDLPCAYGENYPIRLRKPAVGIRGGFVRIH